MKKSISCFIVTLLIFIVAVPAFALSMDEAKQNENQGVFIGETKQGIPLTELNEPMIVPGKGGSADFSGSRMPGEVDRSLTGKDLLGGERIPAEKTNLLKEKEKAKEPKAKKAKVFLKVEPGDGLVRLSWDVKGLQVRPGDPPVKFTLFYGLEPGRYEKKIEVGSVREYTLRGLVNNYIYYVKVQGTAQTKQETEAEEEKVAEQVIFSNEVKATPLAAGEQGSQLEKAFARKVATFQDNLEADPFKRELKQFGYDFFQNSLATLTMSDNLPVGGDYIIGPGDSLRVDLWGTLQARYDAVVDRNGEITLPKVGTVKVWGINYSQAKDVINKAISRYYKGYELNVTLGKLRTIQVYVVGEVESPGTYSVSSLATVINALSQAGGPSKNGSLRTVRLLRGGKLVQEVDLYDMLLGGDRSKDVRLENGDTLLVPVIGPVAAVAGEIKRPGIYELRGKTSLSQVLDFAGGITAAGDTARVQVERFEGNKARVVQDYEIKPGQSGLDLAAIAMQDQDMIKVFPVFKALRHVVTLKGNVVRPGEYQYKEGMRIIDLIPSFAALLPDSYLESIEISRMVPPDFHKETSSVNLRKALQGDEKENILLLEQDSIKIFPRSEMEEKPMVSINGEVLNPGTYDYYPRMTVRDLLTAAGSPKRNAFLENAELTRIRVEEGKAQVKRKMVDLKRAMADDPEHNLVLEADDVLSVRSIPQWLDTEDRFVTLKGEFRFPGIYSIAKGERLDSVIRRAGGFTREAYLKGAKFTRKSVQESQQKRMEEVIARSEQDIVKKQGELASLAASKEELEATKASLEGLQKNLEQLKQKKAEGRVVVHLVSVEDLSKTPYNLEMSGGDVLEVPPVPSVVNVMGQVYNPTTFVHLPGSTVASYLSQAGGPNHDAEEDDMYIIKADGSVDSRQQSKFGIRWNEDDKSWSFGSFMSKPLNPGDTLVVPQKLERTAWLRDIKDITTIISQIALTAGTVFIGLK
ncbi:SLBB domain-containing protein [Geotalea sp. SG265]|uniref:SLBB domain-containing protein n=1 Tax=Geotalea sp. SG265 TaxID=2922867 RepID=UPI001FAEC0A1|nr:SLBB domain-containing protein [Geotalea sp. SG265]